MRGWLWLLSSSAGLAAAAYAVGKRLHTRGAAARFLREVQVALDANDPDQLMNETSLCADGWGDKYVGTLGNETFVFLVRVKTAGVLGASDVFRLYTILWGERRLQAQARPSESSTNGFERIHDLLRAAYRRFSGRPSPS